MHEDLIAATLFVSLAAVDYWMLRFVVLRMFPIASAKVQVAAGVVIGWSVIVLASFVLSAFGLLGGYGVWLLVVLMTGAIALLTRQFQPEAGGVSAGQMSPPVPWLQTVGIDVAAGIMAGYLLTYGIFQLPMDWDSMAYHLPLIDHWIQDGHLWGTDTAFWYSPGNNELLGLFLASGFSGDFWVQLHNAAPTGLLLVCVLEFARELRIGRWLSIAVAVAVLVNQPVLRQLISAENDVSVTALFLAASLFGWRYARRNQHADLLIFGCAIGLLFGIKYYALAYALAGSAIPVAWSLMRGKISPAVKICCATIAGVFVLGTYWYVRNWLVASSPLYPKGFPVVGIPDLWNEMRPAFQGSSLRGSIAPEVWPLFSKAWIVQGGPFPWLFVTLSLAVPLGFLVRFLVRPAETLERIRGTGRSAAPLWISVFLFSVVGIYYITPNVVETEAGSLNMLLLQYHPVRFGVTAMVVSGLTLAWALAAASRIVPRLKRPAEVLVTEVLVVQCVWHICAVTNIREISVSIGVYFWWPMAKQTMWIELAAACTLMSLLFAVVRIVVSKSTTRNRLVISLFFILIFVVSTPLVSDRWHRKFVAHFDKSLGTRAVAQWHRMASVSDRACVFDYRYYPYLGSRRQHMACRPLWMSTGSELADYIRDRDATVVVLPSTPATAHFRYQNSREWFSREIPLYWLVYEDRKYVIARLSAAVKQDDAIIDQSQSSEQEAAQ